MSNYSNFIVTSNSVVIDFGDHVRQLDLANPMVKTIKKLLLTGKVDEAIESLDFASRLTKHTSGKFYMQDGLVMIGGEVLPQVLSDKLLKFVDAGLPYEPLVKFWENLQQNPSAESRNDLYDFLEHNGIPLTEDGCFLAYKRVRENWTDVHTGTFDNTIGKVVEMPRDTVNDDRNVTCSHGLHVAAYNYANNFYPNGILVEVKVNPRDVVSVPVDYDQEKMRVCRYEVIAICDGERKELLYDTDYFYDDSEDEYSDDMCACEACGGEFFEDEMVGDKCEYCFFEETK